VVHRLLEQNRTSAFYLQLLPVFCADLNYISALFEIVSSDDAPPFPQYASHLLLHISRKNRSLVEAYSEVIVDTFLGTSDESVRRNLLGVLLCFPVMNYKEGELLDFLFAQLADLSTKPGLVNYSGKKIIQYLEVYPELQHEFDSLLRFREELDVNPGIVAWGRKLQQDMMRSVRKQKAPQG